jgi:hypothetical protein
MPHTDPPSDYPRRFLILRNLLSDARGADTVEKRDPIIDKILRKLELLEQRIMTAAQERGSKGGKKTAERGPDYFRQIAAMRKTRGGGRPRKQAE